MEPDDGMSWEDDMGQQTQQQQQRLDPRGQSDLSISPASSDASSLAQQAAANGQNQSQYDHPSQREPLALASNSPSGREFIDPAEVAETRKLSVTPTIAREPPTLSIGPPLAPQTQRALSISSTASGSSDSPGTKRPREDVAESDVGGDDKRSKTKGGADRKLRKERSISGDSRDSHESNGEGREKKKSSGFLGGLFNRKKKDTRTSQLGDAESLGRSSMDSGNVDGFEGSTTTPEPESATYDPTEGGGNQAIRSRYDGAPTASTPLSIDSSNYTRGPNLTVPNQNSQNNSLAASGPNNSLAPPNRSSRPGSLILTATAVEGFGGAVPELSVLRVFAGDHLQSEATFKTVLINASTTTDGLVRQAMQRFRLPEGEDPADYYLTIKQIEGDEAVLRADERPLQAFEALVERAPQAPNLKRASMGSINSLASNLSLSMTKYGMNDFTDDSTVKLYLHRSVKGDDPFGDSLLNTNENLYTSQSRSNKPLSVATSGAAFASVSPERFSSPSSRFALQVLIYPDDLPDGMVFDTHTEAIIPRSSLPTRSRNSTTISAGVSQTQRRKVLVFPRNTTVAEVIESSLERFGINDGVVEGGDDVEDKPAKRRSASRVRYGLNVVGPDGQRKRDSPNFGIICLQVPLIFIDRELQPSSKVFDAFPSPPLLKTVDRRSSELRRRSAESALIMGTNDDIQPNDPVFILRRAVGTRGPKKGRLSGPLDEIALRQLHRESASSETSQRSSSSSQRTQRVAGSQEKVIGMPNPNHGIDIVVEGGVLKSQLNDDHETTYVFVRSDGETIGIDNVVNEELGHLVEHPNGGRPDLLELAITGTPATVARRLLPVVDRLKDQGQSLLAAPTLDRNAVPSPSVYSEHSRYGSRANTPTSVPTTAAEGTAPRARSTTPTVSANRDSSPTPGAGPIASRATAQTSTRALAPSPVQFTGSHHPHPSIASVMSDISAYTSESDAPEGNSSSMRRALQASRSLTSSIEGSLSSPEPTESGVSRMMAIVELGAALSKPPPGPQPTELDREFLGNSLKLDELHPRVREFFEPQARDFEEINKVRVF